MLYLTRQEGEKVVLDGVEIEVQILKIEGESVGIGIKAPAHLSIHRYEVYEKIIAANQAASTSNPKSGVFKVLRQNAAESKK